MAVDANDQQHPQVPWFLTDDIQPKLTILYEEGTAVCDTFISSGLTAIS